MNASRLLSVASILMLFACIDRLQFEIDLPQNLPVSVSGHISNQPGPYKVYLNSSFDIEARSNLKTPVSARHVNLLDELGNNEELAEVEAGVYQTSSTQGRVGGIYKIRIEFLDDRVYESIPDTLLAPGAIDSLYDEFFSIENYSGIKSSGFHVLVNARGNEFNDIRYMWSMTGTFKSITRPEIPEDPPRGGCYPNDKDFGRCNYIPLCTGLRINRSGSGPHYVRIAPCECCTCWYQLFNNSPVLSNDLFTAKGNYKGISIYKIPLNEWIFMFKIHVKVSQLTLTENAFGFFKSIQNQKEATGSLFQPITGKIPNRFTQVSGTPTPINGIFYATGVHSKSIYITPEDVPPPVTVPKVDPSKQLDLISCLELFPNATNVKPDYWKD